MKHSWIAMEAGITPSTLSNILTGRTSDPGVSVVLAIARAAGQPLAAILDEPSESLLNSEQEVLRQAVDILERRILRSPARPFSVATSGRQSLSEADALSRHDIPAAIHRRGARLVFRANGDTVVAEGIRDGDILYVKPASDIRTADGRLVVCRVDGATLVRKLIATGRGIRLQTGSSSLSVPDTADFELVGVVVAHLSER
jgi:transcriptional regulator with XRE-family HTH domain